MYNETLLAITTATNQALEAVAREFGIPHEELVESFLKHYKKSLKQYKQSLHDKDNTTSTD